MIKFHKEEIKELIEGLTPFPENIFSEDQEWANKHFLPLISIDMGLLRSDLKGTVAHLLNPLEPFEGLIGENTQEFHNEFCGENWIAFELDKDNKYRFLADERYFELAPQHNNEIDEEFAGDIEKNKQTYQENKERYLKTQKLINNAEAPDFLSNFLDNLGGRVWEGNWVNTSPIPPAFTMLETDKEAEDLHYAYDELRGIQGRLANEKFLQNAPPKVVEKEKQKEIDTVARIEKLKDTLSQKGEFIDEITIRYKDEDFIFVGDVAGWSYCENGADAILMFYEPKSRIVLFTFDWS